MKSEIIRTFLREDNPKGDITTEAVFGKHALKSEAYFLAKSNLVVSGFTAVKEILATGFPSLTINLLKKDADFAKKGEHLAILTGPVQKILVAERLCLNVLQRMSGIASLTRQFVDLARPHRVEILDTRKTTPGLREWERRAVSDGGGTNHRLNLSDQYLIKDNHILQAGNVRDALIRTLAHRKKRRSTAKIEIEVTDLNQLREVLPLVPDIILLDNMTPATIRKAVAMRNQHSGGAKKPRLEISGGVNLKNIRKYVKLGVERISIGAITHSASSADISLEIVPLKKR